ncbi:hypothetical protein BKA83DRAFT_4120060 [Pisolithus microcarpus]|nr:hypothetical protein BKA83DRAFT_4120060 [Pisolithus microcarpus]
MALRTVMLLDDYAALSLLVARIDFHALASPVNAIFAHVASEYAALVSCAAVVIRMVLIAVLPVPMQYKGLPPGSLSLIQPKSLRPAYLHLAHPPLLLSHDPCRRSSTLTMRFVFGSPPLPLLPALQQSAVQIKHVDDKVRISPPSPPVLTISRARTIRAADQTCRRRGYNISPLPPTFLLLAVHE